MASVQRPAILQTTRTRLFALPVPRSLGTAMAPLPTLDIILACAERQSPNLARCVAKLQRELLGVPGELLLVASPEALPQARACATAAGVRLLESTGRLVPELWADGWRETGRDAVGFLIPECLVRPGWARTLLGELVPGVAAAGGYFALDT